MNQPPAPFSCTYDPQIPEFFLQAGCTLVISTYQAGKLIFLSAVDDTKLVQLPRNFRHAMAVGTRPGKMAVAAFDRVEVLAAADGLAASYPKQPNTYDTLYVPQATYYTGPLDLHALEWGDDGLWAVNTAYSCLVMVGENYSFFPRWKPPTIDAPAPGDFCHLNGLAMDDGKPRYVTAFNRGTEPRSWKDGLPGGGVLYDLETSEIVASDLLMPHTPRLYDGELYLLLSATGELVRVHVETGTWDTVNRVNGFVRGMAKYGDYVFVAYSRLRENASIFKDLDIAKKNRHAGVEIFHLPTGARVGGLRYVSSVDEIFDIQILPGKTRPGILNPESDVAARAVSFPGGGHWTLPENPETSPGPVPGAD